MKIEYSNLETETLFNGRRYLFQPCTKGVLPVVFAKCISIFQIGSAEVSLKF